MTDRYQPELGQMCFGQPHGEFDCPEYIEALLHHLAYELERVERNRTQELYYSPIHNNGEHWNNDTFEMHAYYWGDCTCGWDDMEFDEPHDPECYQFELKRMMAAAGVPGDVTWAASEDVWKQMDAVYQEITARHGLPMRGADVHCTCTFRQRCEAWWNANAKGPLGHDPQCPSALPNFRCGDFEVRWYKYLGRGMSMNREITPAEAVEIFDKCVASVRATEEGQR